MKLAIEKATPASRTASVITAMVSPDLLLWLAGTASEAEEANALDPLG
jgi:hypothetical protein